MFPLSGRFISFRKRTGALQTYMATLHTKERCGACGLWKDKLRNCFFCTRQQEDSPQEMDAALNGAHTRSASMEDTASYNEPSPRWRPSFSEGGERALAATPISPS